MDLIYIENYSLFLDLKLLIMTIKILFMRESTEGFSNEDREEMVQGVSTFLVGAISMVVPSIVRKLVSNDIVERQEMIENAPKPDKNEIVESLRKEEIFGQTEEVVNQVVVQNEFPTQTVVLIVCILIVVAIAIGSVFLYKKRMAFEKESEY
jgi:lipopolysaccharide/colanic/teichoic acid biosynthesis glycosyltransferase